MDNFEKPGGWEGCREKKKSKKKAKQDYSGESVLKRFRTRNRRQK